MLAHEVRKYMGYGDPLGTSMLKIVNAMQLDQRRGIQEDESSEEALWPKLLELYNIASGYNVFDNLEKVMDTLTEGYADWTGEDKEDYDEDDEEGDEGW
ncbi:uncharacterized protein ATNIH1004_010130 [Aspergillus tanneri]|uniref:Uncharacterized protein n=1 Tax=Aspergillus tanneri TaxID=1220188 RepID=A0A5M9M8I0_9EURO|nr:uncharacterized protein ATNIH1004_010130 [Aspergillus tanneri]KAA8643362.1 hypothetical protein ATNIH1004_010130 [Aspergillus tanneri]